MDKRFKWKMGLTNLTALIRNLPPSIYKLGAQSWVDKKFPRHLFVEVTSACNLSCAYCPREKLTTHMDWNLFTSIIDEASHYGRRSFSLHLFGETLLYPKIIEAIQYIKRKNKHHTVLVTTNGTLLNKFADRLVEAKVNKIIWSWRVNNFTSHTIDILRKHGKIRLLIQETPQEEFDRWKTFPDVEIKSLHNYGGNIDLSKWGLKVDSKDSVRWPCYHLWLAPAVRWNGEIVECCNIPKSGTEVLGQYGTQTIGSVWRGERLSKLREAHKKGIYPGACKNCSSWQAYPNIFWGHEYSV